MHKQGTAAEQVSLGKNVRVLDEQGRRESTFSPLGLIQLS